MLAEQLRENPSEELSEFLAIAKEHSTLSESTVRKDFECEDGSVLAVQSHNGGEVEFTTIAPEESHGD